MNKEEWERVRESYSGWEIISDDGSIKPCVGCFGCWIKTPGQCVIKDGYDHTPSMIHRADEVMVNSWYTYGGFSSFVKNVIDRSIGYVLPFFEINEGEMHHRSRYPEMKPMTFIFRGNDLSDEEKQKARQYVEAVCMNLKGLCRDVIFETAENEPVQDLKVKPASENTSGEIIALNCSLRGDNANSKKFLDRFASYLDGPVKAVNLGAYLAKQEELLELLLSADRMILGIPLYVDGIPSAPLRVMEKLERNGGMEGKKIYVIANMGFYESSQLKNLLSQVKMWCDKCSAVYGGGLAIGAGEMLGGFMGAKSIEKGPAKNVAEAMGRLAVAVNGSEITDDIYAGPAYFPRAFYMFAANSGWPKGIKSNGLKKKDLYRM